MTVPRELGPLSSYFEILIDPASMLAQIKVPIKINRKRGGKMIPALKALE
jgi:hypothetical protein